MTTLREMFYKSIKQNYLKKEQIFKIYNIKRFKSELRKIPKDSYKHVSEVI